MSDFLQSFHSLKVSGVGLRPLASLGLLPGLAGGLHDLLQGQCLREVPTDLNLARHKGCGWGQLTYEKRRKMGC